MIIIFTNKVLLTAVHDSLKYDGAYVYTYACRRDIF